MDKETAIQRINSIPQYIFAACTQCGSTTLAQAAIRCRPTQAPCGEWTCATPEEGFPDDDAIDKRLKQLNPEWAELTGYLCEWEAFEKGWTKNPPEWKES